jgi:hypothetical protein
MGAGMVATPTSEKQHCYPQVHFMSSHDTQRIFWIEKWPNSSQIPLFFLISFLSLRPYKTRTENEKMGLYTHFSSSIFRPLGCRHSSSLPEIFRCFTVAIALGITTVLQPPLSLIHIKHQDAFFCNVLTYDAGLEIYNLLKPLTSISTTWKTEAGSYIYSSEIW